MSGRPRISRFASLLAPVMLLTAACADMVGPDPSASNASVFDGLWNDADRRYPLFVQKGVDWNALREKYRPLAIAARDDRTLATVLGNMLAELQDMHVSLTGANGSTYRFMKTGALLATTLDSTVVASAYVRDMRSTGHLAYGFIEPGLGYLRIPSFKGMGWSSETDAALAGLRGATRIVVDVRDNPGGTYGTATEIAGRFTGESRRFGWLRFRNGPGHGDLTDYQAERVEPAGMARFDGDVVLLTDRQTYSSAEVFVLAMRARGRTSVVGDTTAGSSGGPTPRELPNGWVYQLSEWIEYTLDRVPYDGIGLSPDVTVSRSTNFGAAERVSGRDAVLERAIAVARQK